MKVNNNNNNTFPDVYKVGSIYHKGSVICMFTGWKRHNQIVLLSTFNAKLALYKWKVKIQLQKVVERFLSIHTNSAGIVLECMKGSYQYTQIVQE